MDSLGTNTRVGCHALLQGIFPTQGLTPSPASAESQANSLPLAPPGKPTPVSKNSQKFMRTENNGGRAWDGELCLTGDKASVLQGDKVQDGWW